jgi:hypothetical protein
MEIIITNLLVCAMFAWIIFELRTTKLAQARFRAEIEQRRESLLASIEGAQ